MNNKQTFTEEVIEEIARILQRGNSAEVKRERDNVVVVELQRHVKIKSPIK